MISNCILNEMENDLKKLTELEDRVRGMLANWPELTQELVNRVSDDKPVSCCLSKLIATQHDLAPLLRSYNVGSLNNALDRVRTAGL